jgi:hypothetical protein
MVDTSYNPTYAPYALWSAQQAPVPATTHNLPSSIAANGSAQTSLIVTEGFSLISAGITASQNGAMSIQRYLDAGGTVPQGAALSVALTANVAANLDVLDGKPFASFTLTVTNTNGSSVSNLTKFALLLQASTANANDTGATLPVSFSGNAASDGSTTLTTGGAAQSLFGGTVPVNGWAIYNPDATNDLWVSDSATAVVNGVGSIRVIANGGGYETPLGYKPIGVVSVIGATTNQKITARRW